MLGSYRSLFEVRGTAAFSAIGFVARMPISMMGIGTVLLISGSTGRYALAGVVSGTTALAEAVAGPVTSRLTDRIGQARVLRPQLVLYVLGAIGLVLFVRGGAPTWTWFPAAALAGASLPAVGALVRARWAAALPPGAPRQTAFAFESVVDEVIFVTGPPLVTVLATGVTPAAGLVAAVVFAVTGGLLLAGQHGTEPPVQSLRAARPGVRAVLSPWLAVVAGTFLGAGAVFGSVEVIVVAYAQEQGHRGAAGLILAVYAAGSLLAGLVYGVIRWRRELTAQFVVAAVIFGVSTALLLLVRSLPVLAVLMFLTGLSISPVLISGNALVEARTAPGALTQGLTWATTGLILGVTAGAAASGPVIDSGGAQLAFAVPAMAGGLTVVAALAGGRWLAVRRSAMLG